MNNNNNECAPVFIMDFERFQQGKDGEMYIKELCIIDMYQPWDPLYYIFRFGEDAWQALPADAQKTFNYASRRLHRLHWTDGLSRYCKQCVLYHLHNKFPRWNEGIFYVLDKPNGAKIQVLTKEFPELRIVNYNGLTLKTLPEPRFPSLTCPFREHGQHCAFRKCQQLFTHFTS